MPICIGKRACDRARCKQRCRSWFSGLDDLLDMCRNACGQHANEIQTRDDFLCSGRWVNDDRIISQYSIDGCGTNDYTQDDFANEGKPNLWKSSGPIIALALILIIAGGYYLLKR